MRFLTRKPWWQDPEDGWSGHGVRNFFDASQRAYENGDRAMAIEILEWGKRFSMKVGSGGAVGGFESMIEKLKQAG